MLWMINWIYIYLDSTHKKNEYSPEIIKKEPVVPSFEQLSLANLWGLNKLNGLLGTYNTLLWTVISCSLPRSSLIVNQIVPYPSPPNDPPIPFISISGHFTIFPTNKFRTLTYVIRTTSIHYKRNALRIKTHEHIFILICRHTRHIIISYFRPMLTPHVSPMFVEYVSIYFCVLVWGSEIQFIIRVREQMTKKRI